MDINTRKIKVNNFSSEVDKPLDKNLRTFVTAEVSIYEVGERDNQDGTFDEIYRSKVCGSTVIKQEGTKEAIIGKSKRTNSQRLRACLWSINPSEEFYNIIMEKIIINAESVIEFLKDK